ncbi:MAG: hypothetical protein KQA31_03160, partial [Candidatus Aenigmarchaeota archaeon]|nr:hypothetical protein [Candidatus Aenigmarchaeota archaeon]
APKQTTPAPNCIPDYNSCNSGICCSGNCQKGCTDISICCPSGQVAYCSDKPDGTRASYCAEPQTTVTCTDSQGDIYKVGDCVTTTNPFCPSGWVRCTSSGSWACDPTCAGSGGGSGGDIQPSCNIVNLNNPQISQPIFSISSPPIIANTQFIISCSANNRYDCISAYSDSNTQCQFTGWNENTAIFQCNGKNIGTYTASCNSVAGTNSKCCPDSKTTQYNVIYAPLQLFLFLNDTITSKGDGIRMNVTTTSNNKAVSNVIVNFEIRNSTNHLKYTGSCTTNINGQCFLDYQIPFNLNPREFGTLWTVSATSVAQVYESKIDRKSFTVVDCEKSSNCQCYEYCGENYRCVDFRPSLLKCSYYDACSGQNCYSNGQLDPTKCYNADPRICEDQQYLCHGWFIRCGEERVEK